MEINNIIKFLKEQAQKSMRRNGGQLEPKMYFLILYPGQQTPAYFPIPCSRFMADDKGKEGLSWYSQMCWNRKKATSPKGIQLLAVCLVSDAWIAIQKYEGGKTMEELQKFRENNPDYSVSKDPKRQEILMFNVCFPKGATMYCIPYKRKGKNIDFLEELDPAGIPNLMGPVSELYPSRP